MDADDVAASIRRVLAQGHRLAAGQPPRRDRHGDRRRSPTTVELKLKEPSAPLLASLATHRDRAAQSVEANKDALQKAPVGTGPFKFKEWQPNGFILLSQA